MNFNVFLITIAVLAALLTFGLKFLKVEIKSYLMSYLQNFTGILFILSGIVKAVDPMGTAIKMEEYFSEFELTFEGTWISFIAPMFSFFSEHAMLFSIGMIVLEIMVGVVLIMGGMRKTVAWVYFLLMAFYLVLTGYTFLSGFVPQSANFFDFSYWGEYSTNNMRVTDCGCFGDFITIDARTTFLKNIFFIIPGFFFIFKFRDMHQMFTKRTRSMITWLLTIGLILFCMYNYKWNLPIVDFRPFSEGTDIREQRRIEEESMANISTTYILKKKNSELVMELDSDIYIKDFKKYPTDTWEIIDEISEVPGD